jgi:hypothetical protein
MVCTGVPSTSKVAHLIIAPVVLFDLHLMTGHLQEDAIRVSAMVMGWKRFEPGDDRLLELSLPHPRWVEHGDPSR